MSAILQRANILAALTNWINIAYGPQGSITPIFREVRRGPVRPLSTGFPICTIQDAGQTRMEGNTEGFDNSFQIELRVQIVLQLADVWTRVSASDDWSDHVAELIAHVNAWALPGFGVLRIAYQSDDPADALFLEGQTNAVWQIEFAIQYLEA